MRVACVGAGAIGLAAALALAKQGHQVSVFDPFGFEGREPAGEAASQVWALGPRAMQLLMSIGAWRDDSRLAPYRRMRVIDALSDAAVAFESPQLGVIAEAPWVRMRLLEALAGEAIACHTTGVVSATAEGVLCTVDGTAQAFDLVLFAEGRDGTAALQSGFQRIDGGHHQCALVATLAAERPHHGEAFQVFTPEGPLALLPLPDIDGQPRVSLVWSVSNEVADRLQALPAAQCLSAVERASEGVRGGLQWVGESHWIALSQHRLAADAIGRMLAIGDTAHGILPLAGLGANLGLADVAALAASTARTDDGARVARTVARERRLQHRTVSLAMALFDQGFRWDAPAVRLARSAAFRWVNRTEMIRNLIQELAG